MSKSITGLNQERVLKYHYPFINPLVMTNTYQKINPQAFGLAAGVIWGLGVLLLTLMNMFWGMAGTMIDILSMYPWYEVSAAGAFIGLVWGFIDAFIAGFIMAWIYNKVL